MAVVARAQNANGFTRMGKNVQVNFNHCMGLSGVFPAILNGSKPGLFAHEAYSRKNSINIVTKNRLA